MEIQKLAAITKLIRYYILVSSSEAGSGHPTSSLSAADLMSALIFSGNFRFDFKNVNNPDNDRLLFSKGHATPLYYSLYLAAGQITPEELMKLRDFDSPLEGHPTPRFKFTEASTGSLGQGLSIGTGLALAQRQMKAVKARTFVLLGDGEMAEGSVWEAANIASYYKLSNLIAILDVNRLGQSQETSLGWDIKSYNERLSAFGWNTIVIDGHNIDEILKAYKEIGIGNKPLAIIAKTIKGRGISFLENKDGWHGKPLKKDELEAAVKELGSVDLKVRGEVSLPIQLSKLKIQNQNFKPKSLITSINYEKGEEVATRKAYGNALARLGKAYQQIVSLDADVKNSTYAEIFKKDIPERFFEMFIAEQNMAGVAVGMARMGYIPFVSTFACFLTRAFDQIRMAAISAANIKFCGSHAGVSIGQDGPSQMALEDLAMFRAVQGSVVLYPADAVSAEKLVGEMVKHKGISYIRTSRPGTPVIYDNHEEFEIGGSKVHKLKIQNSKFKTTTKNLKVIIVAAGVTLFEAFKAQAMLIKEGIEAIVVDCYSVKPIDKDGLRKLIQESPFIITVEDHFPEGGLGEAVMNAFAEDKRATIRQLAVFKMPRSGKPEELLAYEGIDAAAIVKEARKVTA